MYQIDRKITLLIAEDDIFNRLLVVSMLAKNRYIKVLEAADGEEALKLLKEYPIDILLLDLHMPKVNGFQTLQEIRNIEEIDQIPIMVISSDESEKRRSIELGACSFITKPFKLKRLEDEIYSAIKRKR